MHQLRYCHQSYAASVRSSPMLLAQQASARSCLQEEQDEFDRERQALRSYIIKRCSKAAAFMYGDPQAQQVCSQKTQCAANMMFANN